MKKRLCLGLALMVASGLSRAAPVAPPASGQICKSDALGTSRTLVVGTKGGLAVGLKSYPRTLPLNDHEVVLTFDDGPAPTTPAILHALAEECVRATFFLVGRNAEAMPAVVQRAVADGHTLAHHSYSHPDRTLRRMSRVAAQADILRGFIADDLAAYGNADFAPLVPFFRFPGFADTPELDAALATHDIAVFSTDIWAYDWLNESSQAELGIIMSQLDVAKRGMILLHDTRDSTARMLPALLRALKAGGYTVVHIVPGPGTTETVPAPQGWSSETEKVIAEVFRREAAARAVLMRRPTRSNAQGAPRLIRHRIAQSVVSRGPGCVTRGPYRCRVRVYRTGPS